jgi:hypothetical protein
MVNIPSATATPPSSANPSATPNLTPVAAAPASLPDRLQQILQQVQLTGTIAEPPNGATVTLNTVLGALTLLLPQLTEEKQNQLLQQLMNLFQSQKPVTVTVQPGNPPTQVFMLLPPAQSATVGSINANLAAQISLQAKPLPVLPGATLPAVVLPSDISLPTNASPPLSPSVLPQTYAPQPSPYGLPTAPQFAGAPISLVPDAAIAPALPDNVISGELAVQNLLNTDQSALPATPQIPLPNTASTLNTPTLPGALTPPSSTPAAFQVGNAPTSSLAQPLQALQPGNEAIVRVIAVSLPNQPPPVPQAPDQIVARVIASGPNGEPIIKAGDTTLYIRQSAPLPAGTTLLVTVTAAKAQPDMLILPPDTRNVLAFQQIISALAQIDPQLAQQVLSTSIPQPNAALPATLLFLMSAFKQGNVRNWLGDDAADALAHAGKAELIAKLTQDLDAAAMPARDPVVGEWKSYPIPIYNQGQFQVMNFHVHGDGRKNQEKDAGGASRPSYVRFLIDLRLSRLGPMQFDGFVRLKQLDLIIRSEHSLPEGLHRDLRGLYARTLGMIDYAGSLNFQVGRQNWLNVQKTASKAVVT